MKKRIIILGISLMSVILISSCSSPMDKKFNEATFRKDISEVINELDSSDARILTTSMIRLKFDDENVDNMTYWDILEQGKKLKLRKELLAKEKATKESLMLGMVNIICLTKGFEAHNSNEYITYKFNIKNNSNKNIRAIKGMISFTNLFDEPITSLDVIYDISINANTNIDWKASSVYNDTLNEDILLETKKLDDLKIVWKPSKIIYEDGTILE